MAGPLCVKGLHTCPGLSVAHLTFRASSKGKASLFPLSLSHLQLSTSGSAPETHASGGWEWKASHGTNKSHQGTRLTRGAAQDRTATLTCQAARRAEQPDSAPGTQAVGSALSTCRACGGKEGRAAAGTGVPIRRPRSTSAATSVTKARSLAP